MSQTFSPPAIRRNNGIILLWWSNSVDRYLTSPYIPKILKIECCQFISFCKPSFNKIFTAMIVVNFLSYGFCHLQFSILTLSSALHVYYLHFIIRISSSAFFHQHFVIWILSSAFAIHIMSSAFFHPQFSIRHPPSTAIRSTLYRDPAGLVTYVSS